MVAMLLQKEGLQMLIDGKENPIAKWWLVFYRHCQIKHLTSGDY
jgi:hypothetical protein